MSTSRVGVGLCNIRSESSQLSSIDGSHLQSIAVTSECSRNCSREKYYHHDIRIVFISLYNDTHEMSPQVVLNSWPKEGR